MHDMDCRFSRLVRARAASGDRLRSTRRAWATAWLVNARSDAPRAGLWRIDGLRFGRLDADASGHDRCCTGHSGRLRTRPPA
jgi:hypothetical protein